MLAQGPLSGCAGTDASGLGTLGQRRVCALCASEYGEGQLALQASSPVRVVTSLDDLLPVSI